MWIEVKTGEGGRKEEKEVKKGRETLKEEGRRTRD